MVLHTHKSLRNNNFTTEKTLPFESLLTQVRAIYNPINPGQSCSDLLRGRSIVSLGFLRATFGK